MPKEFFKEDTVKGKHGEVYKVVDGIAIGINYFSPYVKGAMRPDYVNVEEGYVIFWHNPGWVGTWFWKTSIENFKNQFIPYIPKERKKGTVSGVSAVSVSGDFKEINYISGRNFC